MTRLPAILLVLACAGFAQAPVVGDINFYGLHEITPQRLLEAIHLRAGDRLPPSKGQLEDELSQIPGVILARTEAMCCDGRAAALFIGIEERGAPHMSFRSPPAGDGVLPPEAADMYAQLLDGTQRAAARGLTAEDLTNGHPLSADSAVRQIQMRIISFVTAHLALVRDVLRNAAEPEQRAVAATLINYAANKRDILVDLQYALQDPDESVRANALRAINAVAVLGVKRADPALRVAPTWLIELLNSVVLSDRVDSVKALLTLTDQRDEVVLRQIRETAMPSLAEMAAWKTPAYALPPFVLLGRAANVPEDQIHRAWERGDRQAFISSAIGRRK